MQEDVFIGRLGLISHILCSANSIRLLPARQNYQQRPGNAIPGPLFVKYVKLLQNMAT